VLYIALWQEESNAQERAVRSRTCRRSMTVAADPRLEVEEPATAGGPMVAGSGTWRALEGEVGVGTGAVKALGELDNRPIMPESRRVR
jgi:hypothetical protein